MTSEELELLEKQVNELRETQHKIQVIHSIMACIIEPRNYPINISVPFKNLRTELPKEITDELFLLLQKHVDKLQKSFDYSCVKLSIPQLDLNQPE